MTAPGTILVDFDGTVSVEDVGQQLIHSISGGRALSVVSSWKAGEFGSRECLIRECALSRATREDVRRFALGQAIDPGFAGFVREAAERGWDLRVVSDGLEFYIRVILAREGLSRVPVEANGVCFSGDRLIPSFPYAGRSCGGCGNCKGGAVDAARSRSPVVFIGNGLSDRCAVNADVLFAKDALAEFCRERGVAFRPYADFTELNSTIWSSDSEIVA